MLKSLNEKIVAISIFLIVTITGSAQDFSGYVVLNSGDTLLGLIKPYDNEAVMYHEVRFFKNGEKTKFEPREILGYTFENHIFLTMDREDDFGIKRKVFMRILEQGYCTLFTYVPQIKGIDIYDPTFNSGKINTPQYYLQRTGEDLHRIDFKKLRTGQDPYFVDNPQLAYDIQRGKYKRLGIEGAVRRYNKEHTIYEKENGNDQRN